MPKGPFYARLKGRSKSVGNHLDYDKKRTKMAQIGQNQAEKGHK